MGSFDFVQEKFPDLADYGNKAESFLNSDPETCGFQLSRVFESSIEIICGLNNVSTKESDGKDRDKIELINELQNTGVIDSSTASTLTSMRRTRNKIAHNDNVTPSEIRAFFQDSLSVCNWLMQNCRGSVKTSTTPQPSRTVSQPSIHGVLKIREIMEDYRRNSIVAEEKYEGKRITIKGCIASIGKYYVRLYDDGVYCYFSKNEKDFLRQLKSGQKFTVTGTWYYRDDDYPYEHCLKKCQVPPTTEKPQAKAKPQTTNKTQPSTHETLTISKIEEDYRRNSSVASKKYEGKRITITGRISSISSVGKYYAQYRVFLDGCECCFSQYANYCLLELEYGQKIIVTGTFYRDRVNNYLLYCDAPWTPEEIRERERREREERALSRNQPKKTLHQAAIDNEPRTVEKLLWNGADTVWDIIIITVIMIIAVVGGIIAVAFGLLAKSMI